MGHVAKKSEITAIIRRFDLDGDCKITLEELADGLISHHKQKGPSKVKKVSKTIM